MGGAVRSVVISDTVYVGGGYGNISLDDNCDECTVMKLKQDQWTKLPEYTAKWFSMTSLTNRLVLVGGQDPGTSEETNQLAVFQAGKWTRPYPPMNIARFSSTAVSFNNHIIVAGGGIKGQFSSSVEVLDVASRRWYIAQSLPSPRSVLKSTLIGNTLYLMGGLDHTGETKSVLHVNLDELIANALSGATKSDNLNLKELVAIALSNRDPPILWQTLQEVPLVFSAPLSIGRSLLAVGGRDDRRNPSSSIYLYQPDTRRWVKVGDLPTARYGCTCSVLPSGEVIVAGGQTELYSDRIQIVDFFSISD
ncbi:kelch domain-containing protein 8A-like [Halichondria panicea]|uniref:kelch domain-containing protein 8A-like n=1 Tax=Halichondria panicea TaxID=6063 RepID=UPI00312B2DCE